MNGALYKFAIVTFVLVLGVRSAVAECGAGRFTPLRIGQTQTTYWLPTPRDQDTVYLIDPAHQQYAAFALEFGGALASLRYDHTGNVVDTSGNLNENAVELIWGHHPGGMLQPVWSRGTADFNYNPTQAGDAEAHGRGSPVLGAVCKSNSIAIIYSASTDFATDNRGLIGRATAVKNEQIVLDGSGQQNMWSTPYTVTTTASFVPNPSGTPAYYLKVDMFIMNVDTRERVGFGGGYSLYVPGTTEPCVMDAAGLCEFDPANGLGSYKYQVVDPPACVNGNLCPGVQKLVIGKYPNPEHVRGVATSMAASAYFPNGLVNAGGSNFGDRLWNNINGGSAIFPFKIPPLGGLHFIVFVMAGDWAAADAFQPY
jgi:hypothetical protein